MRNYRTVSAPDKWTYIYTKNIDSGLDADKPNLSGGSTFEAYAQGLGYRISDNTLWGVSSPTPALRKYSTSGEVLDSWNLYGSSNGAEIDGDNEDFIWVTTRFDAIAKYRLSAKTDIAEVTYFSMGTVNGVNKVVNGICSPAGEFIYYGIARGVRKARKIDGVIIQDYPLENDPSDLAWDGENIWVSYAEVSAIDCFNPNDFTLVKTLNSPYPNNQGLTWDGENLWVSYPAGNDGNGIIAKLAESSGDSPVKLYYATDTKKFYWNVNKAWEEVPKGAENFISFPDAPNSYSGEAGKIVVVNSNEDGLEFIENTNTSIAKSGSAAMSGDILLEAGDNVTITQDDTAKKIIISAAAPEPPPPTATVSSISKSGSAAMSGDILFEAGTNVTLTEDAAAKKIIISAAALEPPPAQSAGVSSISAMTGDIILEAGNNVTVTKDSANNKIIIDAAAAIGDASSINGIPIITDTLSDGYVLTYDAITGKILLKPKPTGGGDTGKSYSISGVRVFNGLAGSWLNNYTISGVNSTPSPNP